MALAELRVRLNASEVVSTFAASVRDPVARLGQLGVAVDPGQSGSLAVHVDLSSLVGAATRMAQQVAGRDLPLPDPGAVLGQIEALLKLVEEIDPAHIETSLRGAVDQVTGVLKQPRDAGFTALLERILGQVGATPEGKALLGLAERLIQLGGVDSKLFDELKALLPAALGVVRAVGGIMRVESGLSEAERLTSAMLAQAGGGQSALEIQILAASFDYALDRLRAAATDPTLAAEAERATREALQRVDLTREAVARRFAFAESTLLYADLDGALRETRAGLDDASGVDLRAAGDALGRVVDRIIPAFSIPLPPAPAESFDALLALIEAQVQRIAQAIESLDVAKIGAPIKSLTDTITAPIKAVERVGTELTAGAVRAIEQVAQLVSDLPTDELTSAVTTVTAPVRDAMGAIDGVVQGADAAIRQVATVGGQALGDAEQAVDALVSALQGVMNAAAAFVRDLNVDAAVGQLHERLDQLKTALEQASVRPYFDAAVDAIDTTASVLEKVPVVLLPDDVKAEFDALVEPIRSLNVDAVAGEVESWFELQDGKFPFEPALDAELDEVSALLDALVQDLEPFDPRKLGDAVDAELVPLRAQIARLDIGPALAPIEQAIAQVKGAVAGVDPRGALKPVSDALETVADKLDEFKPSTLLAPVQARIVSAREAVITTLRLEVASQKLTDLQREGVRLVTLLDPVTFEPAITDALDAAKREVHQLDAVSLGDFAGALFASLASGDGARRRPATWRTVQAWLHGEEASTRLHARAQRIADATSATATAVGTLDLDGASARVRAGLADLRTAAQALPDPLGAALAAAIALRGDDGGFAALAASRATFAAELTGANAATAALLQLEVGRVDVTAAALRAVAAPLIRLHAQILGILRHFGIRHATDGLGAAIAEVIDVATPERVAGILVPVFTALRGRAEALLSALLDPVRGVIDEVVQLLRLIDLAAITQGLDDVVQAGRDQILALDPVRLLEPTLAAFDALKADVLAFDPVAPLRELIDGLKATIARVLDKLNVERLLAPAGQIFDTLLGTLRALDPDGIVQPLVAALRTLAGDIASGIEGLRDALKRLQAAIPSTEGLAIAGAIGGAAEALGVDVDVDIGF